jgi:hypothetical protein
MKRSFTIRIDLEYTRQSEDQQEFLTSIDWDGFSAAFRYCFKQQNFAFKFCSRLLPTGNTLHRNETRYDQQCPACNESQECNGHLFQCTAVRRQRWSSKTTSALRKRLDATIDPVLSDIMTAGLYSYFQSKRLNSSEFTEYSALYHHLISLQESIGWGHFLRGKISKEWANLQQDYVSRNSPSTKFDKEKWLRLIIKPLIMDCLILWSPRNEERQGVNLASKQSKPATQACRDLRAIYLLSNKVLASDRDLFSKPLNTFLLDDTYSIQCWIRLHKPIIYQSRREAKRNSVTNLRLLPTYYHPIPSHCSHRNQNTHPLPSAQPPLGPTRISDHYDHIPSRPATIPRTILQNQILIRHFQQLPLTFPDAPM